MELKNFQQANANSEKPAGPCELGGHPAHCFFDRSGPHFAYLTLRADMEHGAPLPAALAGVRTLTVLGKSVPVSVVKLDCGAEALRGSVDPELVQAVLDADPGPRDPDPVPEGDAGADGGRDEAQDQAQSKDQAGGPGPKPASAAPAADPLIAKFEDYKRRKAEEAQTAERAVALKRAVRNAEQELKDLREDLASVEGLLAQQHAETVGVGRQLREILDREGI